MNQNFIRHHYLQEQRLLQILRQGVSVQLQNKSGLSQAYLEFNYQDISKIQKLISSKIKLCLYSQQGEYLACFDLDQLYFKSSHFQDRSRIYLSSKYKIRHIEAQNLILAKNNATIEVFKKVCLNQHSNIGIYSKIDQYVNDEQYFDIEVQQKDQIQFYLQSDLNQAQNEAIQKAFKYYVSFIKGPPGCGKTKTISRMARLFGQKGLKVLVGAVSNIANKSLLRQIIKQVQENNYLYEHYNHMKHINLLLYTTRMQEEMQNCQMSPYSLSFKVIRYFLQINSNNLFNQQNIIDYLKDYQQGKTVSNTFLSIYYQAYARIIAQADIIISTTVSATKINNNKIIKENPFIPDVCIIDQASQATWIDTCCFLILGVKRVVFVGDQKQLQPTVISQNKELKKTMFQSVSKKMKQNFSLLNIQYRMNPQISQFPNIQFYQGKLRNGEETWKLTSDIRYFKKYPLSFLQHNQLEKEYVQTKANSKEGKKHFYNDFQIQIICKILTLFPQNQLKNVGIITFYDLQLQHLRYKFFDYIQKHGLTIKTCDGYQGGQKDYIIISTVRCNIQGKVGFCKQDNRVNVAITRAKKGLILIGNAYTLMEGKVNESISHSSNVWGSLISYLNKKSLIFSKEIFQKIIDQISFEQSSSNLEFNNEKK